MTTIREQIETYYKELPEHNKDPNTSHWYSTYLPKCFDDNELKKLNLSETWDLAKTNVNIWLS